MSIEFKYGLRNVTSYAREIFGLSNCVEIDRNFSTRYFKNASCEDDETLYINFKKDAVLMFVRGVRSRTYILRQALIESSFADDADYSQIEFTYGDENHRVDVTELAMKHLTDRTTVFVPSEAKFNLLFTDVVPNVYKTLRIFFKDDGTMIEFPEHRLFDYTLSFKVSLNIPKRIIAYDEQLYTRETVIKFLRKNFHISVANAYQKCKILSMRRLLFCYCYLYVNGGYFCNENYQFDIDAIRFQNSQLILVERDGFISTDFVASHPHSKFLQLVIWQCVNNILRESFPSIFDQHLITGAGVLTLAYERLRPTVTWINCPRKKSNEESLLYHPFNLRELLQIDQIFVLNLPSRTDRIIECEQEFEKLGIGKDQWKKFNAFRGADLGVQQQFKKEYEIYQQRQPSHVATPGSFGCLLSHNHIVKLAKEKGYKRILILEDDFQTTDEFQDRELLKKIGSLQFDMFYLSMNIQAPLIPTSDPEIFRAQHHFSTAAYIVDHKIYDRIINESMNYAKQIDVFYAEVIQKQCNVLSLDRCLIVQRDSFSDIELTNMHYEFKT